MNKLFLLLVLLLSNNSFAKPVTAKSYMVTDISGDVILEKNSDQVRPIASITKMMTVMVVLDANQDLDEELPIVFKGNNYLHSRLPRSVKTLTRHELINLAMVKSDNLAAHTLCVNYPYGLNRCIAEMNHKAFVLGMNNTHYEDPTGLDSNNVSTAKDLVKLVLASQEYPQLMDAGSKPSVSIKVKKRWWQFKNTNPLVKNSDNVVISKTGYINASGGCVAMMLDTNFGQRVIVVLGSKNTRTRFSEAKQIALTVSHNDIETTY
jgi:D-alanyl-D-alanine endopeptidase (penicillin-binding protein 7)